MVAKKDFVERRKHQRLKTKEGVFAVLGTDNSRLGQIKNISKGGLAFQYVDTGIQSKGSVEVEIFSNIHDFYLKKLPIKTIEDFELDNAVPSGSLPIRQLNIKFGEMTPFQILLLEHFLENFTCK